MSADNYFFNRFKLLSRLGEGSFGKIYKAVDNESKKMVAIKVETKKKSSHSQLNTEMKIYKELEGIFISKNVRWPQIYNYKSVNDNIGNRVLVMDLLGPNLNALLKRSPRKKFSAATVGYMAEKMISLVEKFHSIGFVHRDLKPQNFVVEYWLGSDTYWTPPRFPEIFLIDYGLAIPYTDAQKIHAPFMQKNGLKGTVAYSSINTHLGVNQSRRDDMESLGYILTYMLLGSLPWQTQTDAKFEKQKFYKEVMYLKMKIPFEKLLEDSDESMKSTLLNYLFYCSSLAFHQEPDYHFCRSLFSDIANSFTGNIYH